MSIDELSQELEHWSDDEYVLARLALWAGDVDHAIQLLDELLASRGYLRNRYPPNPDQDVVGAAASRLRRQAARLRGEVRRVAESRMPQISDVPHVIVDDKWFVRATLWCHRERRYQALVYLSELKFESRFYEIINALAGPRKYTPGSPRYDLPSRKMAALRMRDHLESISEYSPTIVVEGLPFIEAEPNDFGTMEVDLIWTRRELPHEVGQLERPLRKLLSRFQRSKSPPI